VKHYSTVVGLDVHKETITAGILPIGSKDVTETMKFKNHPQAIEQMVKRSGKPKDPGAGPPSGRI